MHTAQNTKHTSDIYDELLFFWGDEHWLAYAQQHDLAAKAAQLMQGMDAPSKAYIQKHMELITLLPFKEHIKLKRNFLLTPRDFEDAEVASQFSFHRPLTLQELFLYANKYGMRDLPEDVFSRINESHIIDGGAFTGDTLLLFHELFPKSRIFAFEPQKSAYEKLTHNIAKHKLDTQTVPLCRGLSHCSEKIPLYTRFAADSAASCHNHTQDDKILTETITTVTVDEVFKYNTEPLGLIKLDVEGFEKKALQGAEKTIRKHKPVIVAAIYHSPEDFFEIKALLQEFHAEYRFMVRRSEVVMAMADLVLIAY